MLLPSAGASHAAVAITGSSEVCKPPVQEQRRCVLNTLIQAHARTSPPFRHNVSFVCERMLERGRKRWCGERIHRRYSVSTGSPYEAYCMHHVPRRQLQNLQCVRCGSAATGFDSLVDVGQGTGGSWPGHD